MKMTHAQKDEVILKQATEIAELRARFAPKSKPQALFNQNQAAAIWDAVLASGQKPEAALKKLGLSKLADLGTLGVTTVEDAIARLL